MHVRIRQRFTASAQQARRPVGFVRCRRAAATALTAAVFTLMSVAGIALTSDHTHLVYQRDILKAGTDAACLATTRRMFELIDQNLSDEDLDKALRPIARRYILTNIPESRRARATDTLVVTPQPDRTTGFVNIVAEADLGGAIFGSWMYGKVTQTTRVNCLAEGGEIADGTTPSTPGQQTTPSTPPMTELVLAIDITSSMLDDVDGCRTCGESRMSIVKRAAQKLVDTITADAGRTVAVGLVPWHFRVKFDQATRTRWEDLGWAQYPTRRYYPNPYWGSWTNIGRPLNGGNRGGWFPDPHLPTAAGEWHDLPNKPEDEDWQGCVDQRRMSGDNPPGISAVPPTEEPFTMGFYSPTVGYPQTSPISYPCRQADPLPPKPNECFYNPSGFTEADDKIYFQQPQFNCYHSEIVPLTTDVAKIKQKISALRAGGAATYSTLGAVWGHRLLAPTWRSIWSDASVHPVDVAPNVRKVLVLLTDGSDNHLEGNIVRSHRSQACTEAKDAGIEVITVFAGVPGSSLKTELLKCASPAADADDTNSFTGTTSEELEGAFETIGQRLRPLRLRGY